MRKILDFKEFILESQGTQRMSLDDAISLASSSPKLPKEFMDLLRSPFAKRFSEDPYEIVSTPRQIKNGTFMFSMKGSTSSRAVAIFGNGYVRTVPFGNASGVSHVVINYRDLVHMKEAGLFQLKSSMPRLKGNVLDKFLSGKMYYLLSKFIEKKLDTEAPPENFPKFKRGLDIEDRPTLTLVDKSGNDLGVFPAKSIEFTTQAHMAPGEGLLMVSELAVKNKKLQNVFISPETVADIHLNVTKSSFENSILIPASRLDLKMKNSTFYDTVIDTKSYGRLNLKIENSKMERVSIESSRVHIEAINSNLDGLVVKNSHGGEPTFYINLTNCSVKGLELNGGRLEGLMRGGWKNYILLHLNGIKIADSEDLTKIVLQALSEGPGSILTGDYRRDHEEDRNGLGYTIENCDFSGVSFSSINPKKWLNKMHLLYEFIKMNKNIVISDSEFGTKVERVVKVRNLFNK